MLCPKDLRVYAPVLTHFLSRNLQRGSYFTSKFVNSKLPTRNLETGSHVATKSGANYLQIICYGKDL